MLWLATCMHCFARANGGCEVSVESITVLDACTPSITHTVCGCILQWGMGACFATARNSWCMAVHVWACLGSMRRINGPSRRLLCVMTCKTPPCVVCSFITSWFATWLVHCPPRDRTTLYISAPVSSNSYGGWQVVLMQVQQQCKLHCCCQRQLLRL